MLLERCDPGTVLRHLPEPEQDVILARLLRRLWRLPFVRHPFRPLSAMTAHWANETISDASRWPDAGLVREGLRLFEQLPRTASTEVLLATDLHAGNVLQAQREPWLVIDPKPFVGDPAYDATQHLFNCEARMRSDPAGTIRRFADLLAGRSRARTALDVRAFRGGAPRQMGCRLHRPGQGSGLKARGASGTQCVSSPESDVCLDAAPGRGKDNPNGWGGGSTWIPPTGTQEVTRTELAGPVQEKVIGV